MKRKLLCLLCICVLISLCACGAKKEDTVPSDTVYATVNGEELTRREVEYFSARSRTDIINKYAQEYGVTDFSDFWSRDFGGTTPAQALEERAFSKACEAKIKLILMRDNGIYDDISYDGLYALAEKYNAEHKGVKNAVGLTSIDLETFYTYYISTGETELKNVLAQGALKPTQEELDAFENPGGLTENGIISTIVNEKYPPYIEKLLADARIVRK